MGKTIWSLSTVSWTLSLFVLNQLSLLNLTLSNNKDKLEKCLGESIRDAIDDVCEIIRRWQKRVAKRYNQNFNCDYEEFHHLYFDLKAGVEMGDYRIKNNLIKVLEKGNIKYYELQTMSLYKQHHNKVAHKEKWKPEDKNKGQRKEATKNALECIKIATKIKNNPELISAFEKCVKDLYI
ncbi:hypothetical protein RclHR1_22430002 [Rhizophagus clarus]|uniref:Uncharacterized protein n=1 Tax=Rhizophagus clarus TaxID=94130 RepID=A0A2Z6QU36_9GLOM|nr:hypothetical protein RclHR1_22430002 [Rhizophagus clarus]